MLGRTSCDTSIALCLQLNVHSTPFSSTSRVQGLLTNCSLHRLPLLDAPLTCHKASNPKTKTRLVSTCAKPYQTVQIRTPFRAAVLCFFRAFGILRSSAARSLTALSQPTRPSAGTFATYTTTLQHWLSKPSHFSVRALQVLPVSLLLR